MFEVPGDGISPRKTVYLVQPRLFFSNKNQILSIPGKLYIKMVSMPLMRGILTKNCERNSLRCIYIYIILSLRSTHSLLLKTAYFTVHLPKLKTVTFHSFILGSCNRGCIMIINLWHENPSFSSHPSHAQFELVNPRNKTPIWKQDVRILAGMESTKKVNSLHENLWNRHMNSVHQLQNHPNPHWAIIKS